MNREPLFSWRNPWFTWSVGSVLVVVLASLLIGFVWLPSVHKDLAAGGLWAMICRAAGVPTRWYQGPAAPLSRVSTEVVLTPDFLQRADAVGIGRGATLAMQCTACHGARGMSEAESPNLAGQYPEVIYKQLRDFKGGQRQSVVMEALVKGLTERDMRDLAAYYAFLPRANAPIGNDDAVPSLIMVGDPIRNIAPCATCHGGIAHKTGSPWLAGTPQLYVKTQLENFAKGVRRNDINGQMRNVARQMTGSEMAAIASYYASRPDAGAEPVAPAK